MRYELRSIPLWPVTRVAFFVNLVVGFVVGLMAAVFMMPIVSMMATVAAYDPGELDVDGGALSALTMMIPFLTALWSAFFNTVVVIIVVLAYNLVARVVGGIELRMDLIELPSLIPELTPETSRTEPVPAPAPAASPLPPVTDRPEPPPPVISQAEPTLSEPATDESTKDDSDTEKNDNRDFNE